MKFVGKWVELGKNSNWDNSDMSIMHMHLYHFINIKNYKNFFTLILAVSLLTLFLSTLVIE